MEETPPKRKRGRPPGKSPYAKSPAETSRAYRARMKAADKVLKLVDVAANIPPAEVAAMQGRLGDLLFKLELSNREVGRLRVRSHHLENEFKHVEQHNTNILKELIELKKAAATPPKRPGKAPPRPWHGA